MKKVTSYSLGLLAMLLSCIMSGCSEFTPEGSPVLPNMATVSDLTAEAQGFDIVLSWTLPTGDIPEITGVRITRNNGSEVNIDGKTTSYSVKGAAMGADNLYTVKVRYKDGYVSEGRSVSATLPERQLSNVINLNASVSERVVTLSWALPADMADVTAIQVLRDGNIVETLPAAATTCELRKQPMGKDNNYTVQLVYASYYASTGVSKNVFVNKVPMKAAFLLLASTPAALTDDDERAAADWFSNQDDAIFIHTDEIATLDLDEVSVIWVMVDRIGLPAGWKNLPDGLADDETIAALRHFSAQGGSLYLSNMATQLTVPLGLVSEDMAPTVYNSGDGSDGGDVWVINPYLGWDFRNGSDQGFYDRTTHDVYKGLTLEDPNNYGYPNLPLIGPGRREDHNCMWDCNIYGRGDQPDVIKNFEMVTNSLVLATWGHVRDHCVAGIVDFNATTEHGRCIANGFAAYEFNQNSGINPYQHNIEKLTANILEYLK